MQEGVIIIFVIWLTVLVFTWMLIVDFNKRRLHIGFKVIQSSRSAFICPLFYNDGDRLQESVLTRMIMKFKVVVWYRQGWQLTSNKQWNLTLKYKLLKNTKLSHGNNLSMPCCMHTLSIYKTCQERHISLLFYFQIAQ